MSKRPHLIEWQLLDEGVTNSINARAGDGGADETRWSKAESGSDAAAPTLVPTPAHPYWLIWISACGALLLLLSAGWLWHRAQTGLNQIEREVHSVAQAELWLAANHELGQKTSLVVAPEATAWHGHFAREAGVLGASHAQLTHTVAHTGTHMDMQIVNLGEDWSVVEMTAAVAGAVGDDATYRQTRFYRRSGAGWQRTVPSALHWGAPDSLESLYFVFRFHARDAALVAEIAAQVDALYRQLHLDFGLPVTEDAEKIVIAITPTEAPGAALLRAQEPGVYRIASPDLYLAPSTVTDGELVLQALALLLTADITGDATAHYQLQWVRERLVNALRLWALWELELPLGAARQKIVQWRMTGTLERGDLAELCAMHNVWLPAPTLLSIPLTCANSATLPTVTSPPIILPGALSIADLEQLGVDIFWQASVSQRGANLADQLGNTVILTTLIDYVVSRHGRDALPALLAALGEHRSWATLTPALFDETPREFATGWQAYLVAHYGLKEIQ